MCIKVVVARDFYAVRAHKSASRSLGYHPRSTPHGGRREHACDVTDRYSAAGQRTYSNVTLFTNTSQNRVPKRY